MSSLRIGLVVLALTTVGAWAQERTMIGETESYLVFSNHDIESQDVKDEEVSIEAYRERRLTIRPSAEAGRGSEERALPGEWQGFGGVPFGCNGPIYDIERGPDGKIYFGGDFVACNEVVVSNVAAWNPATNVFEALGSPAGRPGPVTDLEFLPNGNLALIGRRTSAVWNGTQWTALGVNFLGDTLAMAVDPSTGDIYVGGSFAFASHSGGLLSVSRVARWDGSEWMSVGEGLNDTVFSLEWQDGTLYAGGRFTSSGATPANRVAAWDGTNWNDLGGGVDDTVFAVAHDGSRLYVGGRFNNAGGIAAESVAVWDGTTWSTTNGPTCCVEDLHFDNGLLYAAGGFSTVNGLQTGRLAIWDGSNWSGLSSIAASDDRVYAIYADADGIFAGGGFSVFETYDVSDFPVNGLLANRIVRFEPTVQQWLAMGNGNGNNLNGTVTDMVDFNDEIWVAGNFRFAGMTPVPRGLARWTGAEWLPAPQANVPCAEFKNLAVGHTGTLYTTHRCASSGSLVWSGAAALSGESWTPLGPGLDRPTRELGADLSSGGVYYGGTFRETLDDPPVVVNRVASWDGSAWNSLGDGAENGVSNSASSSSSISGISAGAGHAMVWGFFDRAGTAEVDQLALWDGASWSSPGDGLSDLSGSPLIGDIIYSDGSFIATGSFDESGTQPVRRIARWDGTTWLPLHGREGEGLNNFGGALHASNDLLFVGGSFFEAGGRPANGLAVWDGDDWRSLGSGPANGIPPAGGVFPSFSSILEKDGVVYVAGNFAGSGTEFSPNITSFVLDDGVFADRFE